MLEIYKLSRECSLRIPKLKYFIVTFIILGVSQILISQVNYDITFKSLERKLKTDSLFSFKECVFSVEKAYDENLSFEQFQENITTLVVLSMMREKSDSLNYKGSDKEIIKKYGSLFKTMTDTTFFIVAGEKYQNDPFHYDFDDVFGEKKWENMFVTKLLATGKGNCHSMPYLYKILCEELGVPCWLALAPNHIYIKHRSEKAGMYNTELTSASFPIDAWLMASGYITLEAIQNGIYMDALDDKKCIALCVLDLAKGYEKKYPDNDGAFILKCCDLTMEYIPNYINALLLKAETKKKQIEKLVRQRGITYEVFKMQTDGKIMWEEMRSLYEKIHKLGYRTMPEKCM